MLNKRQSELLKFIVENYIKTAKPVGSNALIELMNCSSATIRNEMSYLEEQELLEKTHTSSGRIPTDKGYRYYVDNIMEPKELTGEDMLRLQTIFKNNSLILTDALQKSMEIVSELTNYTAIVLGKSSKENKISKIEVVPINEGKVTTIIITDKGHVESKVISTEGVSRDELKQTVEIINKLIVGVPISEANEVLEYEVKPVISKYVKQHELLYKSFYNAFSDFAEAHIKTSNTKNMLMQPDFNNIEKMRSLISKLENNDMISKIEEDNNGINVYIGKENNFDDDVAIIKTSYYKDGEEGTIALIGPKRMEYDRAEGFLNYIKANINEGDNNE